MLPPTSLTPELYFDHEVGLMLAIRMSEYLPKSYSISVEHEAVAGSEIDMDKVVNNPQPVYALAIRNHIQDTLVGWVKGLPE